MSQRCGSATLTTGPPRGWRQRFEDQKECLAWRAWIPHDDNPQWLCGGAKWVVDPYTGTAFKEARKVDGNLTPFLKAPHRSYWRAIGTWDNHGNSSIASKHDGAWAIDEERINAYNHPDCFTAEQANNQIPAYTVGNRGRAQPSAGRAASGARRAASLRRPNRPPQER